MKNGAVWLLPFFPPLFATCQSPQAEYEERIARLESRVQALELQANAVRLAPEQEVEWKVRLVEMGSVNAWMLRTAYLIGEGERGYRGPKTHYFSIEEWRDIVDDRLTALEWTENRRGDSGLFRCPLQDPHQQVMSKCQPRPQWGRTVAPR